MRLPITPAFLLLLLYGLPMTLGSQPLFPVKKDKKWGLMNADGGVVLQPEYDAIGEFKQFGYAVMQRSGKVGLLDQRGAEIVPPRYDDLKALDSLLISVMTDGKWQVINMEGKVVLKPGYEKVEVLTGPKTKQANHYLAFMVNKKWGIIDAGGQAIAPPIYDEVSLLKNIPNSVRGAYFQTRAGSKLGLLLSNGFVALPPSAEEITIFDEQLFFFKKTRKWGAIGRSGNEILPPVYDHFSKMSENFVRLVARDKAFLFSLLHYTLATSESFEAYYPFSEKYVLVKRNRLLGLLDHCGALVLEARYDEIQPYGSQLFRANLNGQWGIVSASNQMLIPFEYDYIAPMRQGLCIVIQQKKLGVANQKGEVVVAPAFDRIELEDQQAKAYRRERLTLFNFDGEGKLLAENNFPKHFSIKIIREADFKPPSLRDNGSPYQLEKFEWFYSPRDDKWGLRRLDNGVVQIEPSFHEVRVEKELGLTLVGVEMKQELDFDRTTYRFDMAYGLVKNDTGLLVREVDLIDIRLDDFDQGLPVARCTFTSGRQGLVNRIGKVVQKDFAYIGDFHGGVARASITGRLGALLPNAKGGRFNHLGKLQEALLRNLSPATLTDYTQYDLDLDKDGLLTCETCHWGYLDTSGKMTVQPQFDFAKDLINDVGIVAIGEKWGLVSKSGKQLLPCLYDEVAFLENTGNSILRIFKKEEKYGLIDTLGQIAVNAQYEDIGSFSEGRLAVKRQGMWGFVDRFGREVIPCRFDETNRFSEGWAAVRLGSKWGFIDKNGNVELDFVFSKAGNFNNGLAPAKREGPFFGFINPKGEWAIQPIFPKASDFDRGVARVEEPAGNYFRTGLIDTAGSYIVKPKFISLTPFDQHGLATAGLGGNPLKYGLVNMKGQIISTQPFRSIGPFREGLAKVQTKNGWGFINTRGEIAIAPRFQKTGDFSEGKAVAWTNGLCGFIDASGAFVIGPQFSRCLDFHEGKAIVFKGGQRAGLIDASGQVIIEPGADRLLDFADGRGLVRDQHYQFYYITEQARFYDGFYEKAGKFRHGVAVVQVDGRWAVINQQGIEIIPPKYDRIDQFENGLAKVRIKGFSGLTNLQGELIVQADYEYISYAGEGLFRVEQGDKIGYFDVEGRWVWGLQE